MPTPWSVLFVSQNGVKCKTSRPPRSKRHSKAWRSSPIIASKSWPTPRQEMVSVAMFYISKLVKTVSSQIQIFPHIIALPTIISHLLCVWFWGSLGFFFVLVLGCRGREEEFFVRLRLLIKTSLCCKVLLPVLMRIKKAKSMCVVKEPKGMGLCMWICVRVGRG